MTNKHDFIWEKNVKNLAKIKKDNSLLKILFNNDFIDKLLADIFLLDKKIKNNL